MDIISAIAGAIVGASVTAYIMRASKPLPLPPRDGYIVCTRKDGTQHYRKLRRTDKQIHGAAQIDIEDAATQQPAVQ